MQPDLKFGTAVLDIAAGSVLQRLVEQLVEVVGEGKYIEPLAGEHSIVLLVDRD